MSAGLLALALVVGGCASAETIFSILEMVTSTPAQDCARDGGKFYELRERQPDGSTMVRYECRK